MDIVTRLMVLALAVYGLANAIAVLKAGKPLRTWLESREIRSRRKWAKWFWQFWGSLFKCPPCLSFWIGMAASTWVLSITSGLIQDRWLVTLSDGFILCATSYFLHLFAERLGHGLDI